MKEAYQLDNLVSSDLKMTETAKVLQVDFTNSEQGESSKKLDHFSIFQYVTNNKMTQLFEICPLQRVGEIGPYNKKFNKIDLNCSSLFKLFVCCYENIFVYEQKINQKYKTIFVATKK